MAGNPKSVFVSVNVSCFLFSDNPNISESKQTTPPINSEYRGSTVVLLIAIHPSDGDVKPDSPLGAV